MSKIEIAQQKAETRLNITLITSLIIGIASVIIVF